MEDLQAVVHHGGHHAGVDPHADQDTDDDQDTAGLEGLIDAVHHGLLDLFPLVAQVHGHQGGGAHAHKHGHMGIDLIVHNTNCQDKNQNAQGNQCLPQLWHAAGAGFLFFTH